MTIKAQSHSDQSYSAVIGYEAPATVYCRGCAPEGLVEGGHYSLHEGGDCGVPFRCDICGSLLAACEHEWSEWRSWFSGGDFRICDKPRCGETEHR